MSRLLLYRSLTVALLLRRSLIAGEVSRAQWLRQQHPVRRTFVHVEQRGGSDSNTEDAHRSPPVSVCSSQGGRAYMEDEYFCNQLGTFCAVFDGHGGKAVSRYLRQNLYANVQAAAPLTTVEEYKEALCAALDKVDREVNRISHWSFQGSTAVAVWIHSEQEQQTVIAANVGDSRAVLSRNRVAVDLTCDHKPNEASEKARVEAMGGKVVWCGVVDSAGKPVPNAGIYRVNGNLALSRAIGDRSERPAVTAKPDLTTWKVRNHDEFIVLGSDGLWDVMTSQEVVDFVHANLENSSSVPEANHENDSTPQSLIQEKMADMIVTEALKRGTTDNVTVIIMWLKHGHD